MAKIAAKQGEAYNIAVQILCRYVQGIKDVFT